MTLPRVLVADPPWPFRDKLPGETRGAASNYKLLSIEDLCVFPRPVMADDSWLFLWYVNSMVDEARRVCRAWGFEPTGVEFVWVKTTGRGAFIMDPLGNSDLIFPVPNGSTKLAFGMGRTVRNCDERCIIARQGKPYVANKSIRSVFFAPVGKHSAKPERFYILVQELCGAGPYVELFARKTRPGWTCYGDEIKHAVG